MTGPGGARTTSVDRFRRLAQEAPAAVAVVEVPGDGRDRSVSRADLDGRAGAAAAWLRREGVGPGHVVVLDLPADAWHLALTLAAWQVGACVLPLDHHLPPLARAAVFELVAQWRPLRVVTSEDVLALGAARPLPAAPGAADPAWAIASGGTSGAPKVVVDDSAAWVQETPGGDLELPALFVAMGARPGQVRLVCTPLHHVNGFLSLVTTVVDGGVAVLLRRFDAGEALRAIRDHRVQHLVAVPTVLQRMADHEDFSPAGLVSLQGVGFGGSHWHGGGLQAWLSGVGPDRLFAGYGATEAIGKTVVRAEALLTSPGCAGTPVASDLLILGDDGREVPTGTVGLIYGRPHGRRAPAFRYLGADYAGTTAEGFVTVGDLGWLDADGRLHVSDRRTDLVVTGGANVFPAQVERVLAQHPDVADVAVVGLPDPRWGRTVHAVLVLRRPVPDEDLTAWCRDRLAPYACPASYERRAALSLTAAGKVSRARVLEMTLQDRAATSG